ncbi:MAG: S9 family peptidase [Pseudomonadota bacterium]
MRNLFQPVAASILLVGCTTLNLVPEDDTTATDNVGTVSEADANAEPSQSSEEALEYIAPTAEAMTVGLAGEDPADIGRYLLARGASGPLLSPDGNHIAYYTNLTGVPQIWTRHVDTGETRQLTFGNGVTFFRWTPDSTSLVYGSDNDGNEREAYYRIKADGSGEKLLLPSSENGFRAFGDIAADGETAAFASTERNGIDFDIYTANLNTGDAQRVLEGTFGYFARSLSPDGTKLIVTETVGEDSDNLFLLDLSTGELETLSKPSPRANHSDGGFAWTTDSSSFYFSTNRDREFSALQVYSLDTANGSEISDVQVSTSTDAIGESRDVVDVNLCGENGRYLIYSVNVDGFFEIKIVDITGGASPEVPSLPEGVFNISCSTSSSRVAIGVNGWKTPGDIYLWDLENGETEHVFKSNYAGLDPDRLIRPESIRIAARDGVELQGLLYLPDNGSRKSDDLPPVIFQVHGGPTGQSMATFDPVVQYHVDRGLAVFEPNVRGSTGFGRTYVTLDDRENRRDSVRDLADLLDGLRTDGRVDVDNAAVMGGSYGGYMVNAVLALYPDAFKAGVSLFGVADWVTALQVASPALKASDRIEYGDIREEKWIDYYTENSPIRLADQIKVPVLYSHGVMDPRIDIAETETMVRALRSNGIDAPFIRIPDEGHGWRKMSNRLFYFRRQADFLEKTLQ